ncbi:PREDICTED: uncharacterized protein LOC109584485 isoform X2 [Amphimedon queenslandica]|uniref:Dynamin N-terminal domain-containing protein n=1 Tax=Amphimedon queenslandica TaxID=400682 RepID=A0AAN0JG88_AMPQE|nr:PREDICTED: uncharacterized protein LOC109584485 isoform X2 [Amphimedon queenslandica]|eukprot:XP_019855797.1 PREDICTED: uncharacterized protein LOC109584485 isoform X2 [Amphimedon queenslandica]
MAEAVAEVTEIACREADKGDNWGINSSMQRTNEEDADLEYSVFEVLEYHESDEDDAASKNRDFFTRLWTGNVLFSGKKGAVRIIKYFAGGAQNIGHKFVQAICQESSGTAELPETITETCQLILDTVRKYNGNHSSNNILLQEKWLDETEYLLQNKVLTIGVFGRHKAGKSTLLNALLHHEVLPATSRNETAFILRICHKASNHHGSSCFEDTEQFLSVKEEEVKGSNNIQLAIHNRNTHIRKLESTATMDIDKLVAHVPFLCRCATGDIKIVLLDTPGLSESNELGISEVSEHGLMTCSVYIYVMSCQQLEDSIDTDSLRAIVKRDPNAFKEKRILIAVTKLDEYEMPDTKFNDLSDSNDNNESFAKHIDSIKKIIQDQCKGFVSIPDDCIIPLCATGALEARKEKLGGKRSREMKVLMAKLDVSTAEEIEKVSQVISLEEKLIEIASRSHYLWHYNIVRDCIRYLDQAMRELDENKKEFMKLEKKFNDRVEEKEGFMEHFKTSVKKLRAKYANGSDFCRKLEDSYDKNLERLSN